jgi:hypothetical protein
MILITEQERIHILNLYEQDTGFTRYLDKQYRTEKGTQEVKQMYMDATQMVKNLRQQNPFLFDTIVGLGLFAVPYVGPYLSAGYGTTIAIKDINDGRYVQGIIGLITSPLGLLRALKVLKIFDVVEDKVIKMLQEINKTGLPVLISQGQQKFLEWGYKTFSTNFDKFMKMVGDKKKMELLIKEIASDLKNKTQSLKSK